MRETGNIDKSSGHPERETISTIIAFFVFGALLCGTNSLAVAGAQDILAGTFIQTSTVLVANTLPNLVACLIAPYFMQTIPYSVRIAAVGLSYICGALVFAIANEIHWKLFGIALTSFALGAGETTVSALTSFYLEVCLSAFSSGTGTGFAMAPLYYMAMTTWACVSPQITIVVATPFYLLFFVCYYIMDKRHLKSPRLPGNDTHSGVEYTALVAEGTALTQTSNAKEEGDNNMENGRKDTLSSSEKFKVIWQMLPDLIPLFIAWLADYLTIQAVVTTLAFPNAPFEPRDHYQYYVAARMLGEVVGRSYLAILSFVKVDWTEKAKFPYLWVLAGIQVALLLLFIMAAWYRFLKSVWTVVVILFIRGVAIGVTYVNALAFFRDRFEEPYREFAMGYILVSVGAGAFVAALVGLTTEPILFEHCKTSVNNTKLCFTRSRSLDRFSSVCSS